MGIIGSILIGMLAGFLAGKIMRGGGFGWVMNLVIGVAGGLLGGLVFGMLGFSGHGIAGRLITAVAGAVLLLWIASLFRTRRSG